MGTQLYKLLNLSILFLFSRIKNHLVPGPGHAAAGVPAQAGALQVRVCVLIIANPEVLTIAEDNIRLDNAAL